MHSFAVVHVPRGSHLPPHAQDLLHHSQPADLPFRAEGHLHWSSDDHTIQFGGWHAGGEHLGRGSYWDVRPSGLTAFAGTPWVDSRPWDTWVPWASQIADHLDVPGHSSRPAALRSVLSRTSGCFTILGLGADSTGAIGADPLGLHVLYTATAGNLTVVSNRAALAARLITGPGRGPARDAEGAVWVAYAGSIIDDRTSFRDVRVLPVGSTISFGRNGPPEVFPGRSTPWLDTSAAVDPLDPASYAPAVEDLRSNLRLVLSIPAWKHDLELTGGKDSRMILGMLLADERAHDVSHLTWGGPDLPDVVVANVLADRFDLDLDASGRPPGRRAGPAPAENHRDPETGPQSQPAAAEPDQVPEDRPAAAAPADPPADPPPLPALPSGSYDAMIRRHLWLTSGAINIWEAFDRTRLPQPHLSITGLTGEVLRTNHPASYDLRTRQDLALFVDAGGLGHDRAGLVRPEARRELRRRVDDDLDVLFEATGDARDAIDGYYQIGRLRRWFGVGNELDNRNRMLPLYSMTAFRTAFSIGADHRRAERLAFEVMSATAPELTTIPFANRSWSPRLTGTLADPARFPTTPDPAPPAIGHAAGRSARWGRRPWGRARPTVRRAEASTHVDARELESVGSRIPLIRGYLDLGPRHQLYDFLDYEATMRAVTDLAELDLPARKAVFGAATAAMWLVGADMPLYAGDA